MIVYCETCDKMHPESSCPAFTSGCTATSGTYFGRSIIQDLLFQEWKSKLADFILNNLDNKLIWKSNDYRKGFAYSLELIRDFEP